MATQALDVAPALYVDLTQILLQSCKIPLLQAVEEVLLLSDNPLLLILGCIIKKLHKLQYKTITVVVAHQTA